MRGHAFVCLVRSVYLDADDTILMAVEVCGDTLLSWTESMLATPPFFYQMAGMAVGRDPDNVQGCQINEFQVHALHTHLQAWCHRCRGWLARGCVHSQDTFRGCPSLLYARGSFSLRAVRYGGRLHYGVPIPDRQYGVASNGTRHRGYTRERDVGACTHRSHRRYGPSKRVRTRTHAHGIRSRCAGLLDAIERRLANSSELEPAARATRAGIYERKGSPLNAECEAGCAAGSSARQLAWQSGGNTTGCTLCMAGMYSRGGKAAECKPCSPGHS